MADLTESQETRLTGQLLAIAKETTDQHANTTEKISALTTRMEVGFTDLNGRLDGVVSVTELLKNIPMDVAVLKHRADKADRCLSGGGGRDNGSGEIVPLSALNGVETAAAAALRWPRMMVLLLLAFVGGGGLVFWLLK